MDFLKDILERSKKLNKKIALPETQDERVISAADYLSKNKICKVVLIGNEEEIRLNFAKYKLIGVEFLDPKTSENTGKYIDLLFELRKAKGATIEWARNTVMEDKLSFACLALKSGDVDGVVAGAVLSSAAVSRAAFQIVKAKPGINSVSSCFVMVPPKNSTAVSDDAVIFSDCGVIPYPTKEQLVDIVFAAKESCEKIIRTQPKIAMLSFSTKGSAKHPSVDLVQDAYKAVIEKDPTILVDGELQFDAAIVESVAKQKAKDSKVAGHANVFVFPNLDAGNIGYKIAQRLGNFVALGPLMQGLSKPINDLSRGCNYMDIVYVSAITCLQSQE